MGFFVRSLSWLNNQSQREALFLFFLYLATTHGPGLGCANPEQKDRPYPNNSFYVLCLTQETADGLQFKDR